MGKEEAPCDHKYDVTGCLCENNDKFAVDRMLPEIDMGDLLVIHDTGAHGHAMGYNYNGRLRSAELLLQKDGYRPAHSPGRDPGGLFRHGGMVNERSVISPEGAAAPFWYSGVPPVLPDLAAARMRRPEKSP